ncbi:MAG TPA: sensor histidine kinase [Gammaproteobacteria bacterium]|nr:sensor histidine kinase [Gammaproteobacteria bacterium]
MSDEADAAPESPRPTREAVAAPRAPPADEFFLPDFCHPRMVLAVVLISELLAVVLALARSNAGAFLTDLARLSLFAQWLGLTGAGLLCFCRPRLAPLSVPATTAVIFALLMGNTALFSALAIWFGRNQQRLGFDAALFSADEWHFLLRNEAICAIVTALVLRYFFVAHQWRHHVRAEARSRIDALQARIRPHFLFNSMNTIAALTRSDPARAEEAVEDLADLFRATLRDSDRPLTIKEELELTRIYQRIEELRIGDRLKVEWDVAGVPMRAKIPSLTIQPLLENAIYHGIEPLDTGGTVAISGRVEGGRLVFSVTNPMPRSATAERSGNRLALDNIRQRLRLAYAEQGVLEVEPGPERYRVTLRFPLEL